MFLSTLLAICLVLALISWLSVGTFWLAHDQPRLETEYDVMYNFFKSTGCPLKGMLEGLNPQDQDFVKGEELCLNPYLVGWL